MFLSRFTGDPIGFSVLGIFVIDKNTILMVKVLWKCSTLRCSYSRYWNHKCKKSWD